jgi:TrmH family RNA methyltransferase
VRRLRRLADRAVRSDRREFLAEGPQTVGEALAESGVCVEVLATQAGTARHAELLDSAQRAQVPWTVVDDDVLQALADTVSPQGVVARCRFVDVPVGRLLVPPPRLLALCADVRDPGNAGTVVRCADAAGADGVVLTGSSVDPYNPKVVRASVGSLFHIGLAIETDAVALTSAVRGAGLTILAADAVGDLDLDQAADAGLLDGPTAWLFGNEAWGLPPQIRGLADRIVNVPIHGRAESLNLATAAAVCLYASARAHRAGRG